MEEDDPIELGLATREVEGDVESIHAEIYEYIGTRRGRFAEKFFLAAISSIPWVGGYLSAAASLKAGEASSRITELQVAWLEQHHYKIRDLQEVLGRIDDRFASLGDTIIERLESEEYLSLVHKAFRVWNDADTQQKREYVANVVTNSGGTRLCSDDVVSLFIDWLESYHESHLSVIREIHKNPGSTRHDVWTSLYNIDVRDDSAEADLFKFLFRDLSMGGVIRQERDINQRGEYLTMRRAHTPKGFGARTMKSPFDDKESYVLTAMGRQFVHYTMNDAVTRLTEDGQGNEPT